MEHYIEIEAKNVADLVLKPACRDEKVRVHADGFVTMGEEPEVFAAVDMWDASADGEGQLNQMAYILKETPQDDVSENGVDRFITVDFGRIKPFLRVPDSMDSPLFVYASGMVTLASEDLPLAQMRDWEDEDIWKLTQLANKHGAVIMTKSEPEEDVAIDFEADGEGQPQEFW